MVTADDKYNAVVICSQMKGEIYDQKKETDNRAMRPSDLAMLISHLRFANPRRRAPDTHFS